MTINEIPSETVRVLVVEDNADDRYLLLRQLKNNGIDQHVKFIDDGAEALAYLTDLPPQMPFCDLMAIFLDLKLPSMSGLELLKQMKTLPRIKNIPVIVMTSSLDPRDFEECQRLKVACFVPKPVTFDAFSKAITGLVHLHAG